MATTRVKVEWDASKDDPTARKAEIETALDMRIVLQRRSVGTRDATVFMDAGFADRAEGEAMVEWLREKMNPDSLPGRISIHDCTHMAGEPQARWTDCKTANYQEYKT